MPENMNIGVPITVKMRVTNATCGAVVEKRNPMDPKRMQVRMTGTMR